MPSARPFVAVGLFVVCGVVAAQPAGQFQPVLVFKGHTDPIYAVAVSPDGKIAATASFDKTIKLWDPTTGKEVRSLGGKSGHTNQVLCVAFTPAGDQLATGGSDNQVKIWDLAAAKASGSYVQGNAVTRVAVAPDGKTFAVGTATGPIKLGTTADGKAGAILTGHAGPVVGLGFSANGATLISAGADKTIRYWNPATGQLVATLGASVTDISGFAINPGSGVVSTASVDGKLKFWPATVTAPKGIPPLPTAITGFALSIDGTIAVTAHDDKTVRLTTLASGAVSQTLTGVNGPPTAVAIASGNATILAGGPDGKVTSWGNDGKAKGTFPAHDGAVTAVAFHPSQPSFFTAGVDGVVRTWGSIPAAAKQIAHPEKVSASVVHSDGKRFVTGSADKLVRIIKDGVVEKTYSGHDAAVTAVAEVGGMVLSGDAAGGLIAWAVDGKKTAVTPAGPKAAVIAIVPQPGSAAFAVVYASGEVQFRPVVAAKEKEKTQEPKTFAGTVPVLASAFTADGKKFLTITGKALTAWDIATAKSDPPVALGDGFQAAAFTVDRSKIVLASATKLTVRGIADPKPIFEVPLVGDAEAVAFSPSGSRIAVALASKTGRSVRVYDAVSGRDLQTVAVPTATVRSLGFLADNKSVAFAGDDKQLAVVDSTVTAAFPTGAGNAATLAIHPGTGQIITAGADKIVRVWDPATGKEAKAFPPHNGPVTVLALSRDGQSLAVASGKAIKVWTMADGKEVPFPSLTADVRSLGFSPDRTKLIAGMADNTAWVYDLATGQPTEFVAHAGPVVGVSFHPGQPQIITASADKTLTVTPLSLVKQVLDPAAVGGSMAITANGATLLTSGAGPGVGVWNLGNSTKERALPTDGPITAVAVSKDNVKVAIAHGAEPTISIVTLADGAVVGKFKSGAKVAGLAFHPGNAIVAGILPDNRVVSWSVGFDAGQPLPPEFGKPVQEFPHPARVSDATFTPDGTGLVTGCDDKQLRVWKVASDQPSKTLPHPNLVDAVAYDKTGTLLATGCHDGILRVFDVAKATATKTINAHTTPQANPIYAVAWTPDGKQIATTSFDKTIKFWDATAGTLVKEIRPGTDKLPIDPKLASAAPGLFGSVGGSVLNAPAQPGHRDQVFTLAFTRDGKKLVTGSSDRTIKLWDVATGDLIRDFPNPTLKAPPPGQPIPSHPGFVHQVRFNADESKLISVGTAPRGMGYAAVWGVADGRLLAAQELPVGPIYAFDLLPNGVLLGCGPKARFQPESEAVIVPLPVK